MTVTNKVTIQASLYYKLIEKGIHIGEKQNNNSYYYSLHSRGGQTMISLEQHIKRLLRAAQAISLHEKKNKKSSMLLFPTSLLQHRLNESTKHPHAVTTTIIKDWKNGFLCNQHRLTKNVEKLGLYLMSGKATSSVEKEAYKLHIPVYGIYDSNANYRRATYCIPGNDNTPEAQFFYLSLLLRKKLRKSRIKKNLARQNSSLYSRILQESNLCEST